MLDDRWWRACLVEMKVLLLFQATCETARLIVYAASTVVAEFTVIGLHCHQLANITRSGTLSLSSVKSEWDLRRGCASMVGRATVRAR